MPTLMESKTAARQHALIRTVLVEQTKSLGRVEIPLVEDLLRRNRCRTELDIGCGEGSFLRQLADKVKGARFLGVDHNERAINDALRRLRRRPQRNVKFGAAFFNSGFVDNRYDAVLTRYTLQHSSKPGDFLGAAFARLKKKGLFVAMESLDAYTDSPEPDPVWERYRAALGAVHKKIGSDANIGRSLGRLFKTAGFRDIQVRIVLCSPSTVGWSRFQGVVRATAELAFNLFPDLFDRTLLEDLKEWLRDRAGLEEKDPYICSAIANGTRP